MASSEAIASVETLQSTDECLLRNQSQSMYVRDAILDLLDAIVDSS